MHNDATDRAQDHRVGQLRNGDASISDGVSLLKSTCKGDAKAQGSRAVRHEPKSGQPMLRQTEHSGAFADQSRRPDLK